MIQYSKGVYHANECHNSGNENMGLGVDLSRESGRVDRGGEFQTTHRGCSADSPSSLYLLYVGCGWVV
jgi:hypothetical protein